MRFAILLVALAFLMPACDSGDTEGDPSATPPVKNPNPVDETPEIPAVVDPGPEVATETIVLNVSGMT